MCILCQENIYESKDFDEIKEISVCPLNGKIKSLRLKYDQIPLPANLRRRSILNQLKSLPILPKKLEILNCCSQQITSLPTLPENLKDLRCYSNKLSSLPPLPKDLKVLYCWNNQLETLPSLPEGLEKLDCFNNQLKYLPPLPKSLEKLDCGNNIFLTIEEEIYQKFNIFNIKLVINNWHYKRLKKIQRKFRQKKTKDFLFKHSKINKHIVQNITLYI